MQRDQKVGLALGVLLIGVVAAFFFRNEPDPMRGIPTLENAEGVDREIAEKRLTPYFAPVESPSTEASDSAKAIDRSLAQPDERTGERKLPRWEDVLKETSDDPFASNVASNQVPAPDPIQYEVAANTNHPSLAQPYESTSPSTSDSKSATMISSNTSESSMYEVQRGDTLSSLAGKFLGSQAKFQEIFAANRDQLSNANELKVGMKLRIPSSDNTTEKNRF